MVEVKNNKDFEETVLNADTPVLVDFWAPWCGPCRMVGPVIDKLAEEKKEVLRVVKVNVDELPELASRYNVMAIPTLIFFNKGEEVTRLVGAHSKEDIERVIHEITVGSG